MATERQKSMMDGPALVAAVLINLNTEQNVSVCDMNPYRDPSDSPLPGQRLTAGNLEAFGKMIVGHSPGSREVSHG